MRSSSFLCNENPLSGRWEWMWLADHSKTAKGAVSVTSHYRALVERLIYCIVSYDINYYYKGKVNVGIFYSVISPKNHFEKNVRPNLKSTEDLFKMLNGEVKVYESYKGMTSKKKTEEEIKEKEKEFERDLKNAFEIGAELAKE